MVRSTPVESREKLAKCHCTQNGVGTQSNPIQSSSARCRTSPDEIFPRVASCGVPNRHASAAAMPPLPSSSILQARDAELQGISKSQHMYKYRLQDASTSTAASMLSCLSSFIKYRYSCQVQRMQSVHGHAACEGPLFGRRNGEAPSMLIAGLARAQAYSRRKATGPSTAISRA
ncbi:hypothetical protein M441DRAFT_391729 [Trichoderma asperellum CBS 433.97]|uniref:Uncharacterized protein n=1 Tax=Trichoderma asperellum (strain ATCC 204424 / CBS 433.97 / NBRC 101777) TaxID=1042311 RepID=A0A2T3ZCM5_TRIA4|nr:hypothetical protein M441DRAFT_391729 [Trichoderma asperellum CBS 433.97]PTB42556.1 hypothetical protein M441DRAFT_391729 [Trichoderma asperellum CBS 433.97]